MKLMIDLAQIDVNDWNDTIASILKDEIHRAVRAEVQKAVKTLRDDVGKMINKVFKGALSEKALEVACKSALNTLLGESK